jgi:hypothetical protein
LGGGYLGPIGGAGGAGGGPPPPPPPPQMKARHVMYALLFGFGLSNAWVWKVRSASRPALPAFCCQIPACNSG